MQGVAAVGHDDESGVGQAGGDQARRSSPTGSSAPATTSVGASIDDSRSWSGSIAPWPAPRSEPARPSTLLCERDAWMRSRCACGSRCSPANSGAASHASQERLDAVVLQAGRPARRPPRAARRALGDRRCRPMGFRARGPRRCPARRPRSGGRPGRPASTRRRPPAPHRARAGSRRGLGLALDRVAGRVDPGLATGRGRASRRPAIDSRPA